MKQRKKSLAAIFDLDGLLIDSEPLWTRAEIEVFGTVGIFLNEKLCRQTVGLGLREVVEFRYNEKPWATPSKEEIAQAIHRRMIELVALDGRAMPGAYQTIEWLSSQGIKLALASASDPTLIEIALKKIGLDGRFAHVQSSQQLPYPKPHPAVYLTCAEQLGVSPLLCVGFEDSLPGLIAVKAARMKAVVVPDPTTFLDPRYSIADLKLGSLEEFGSKLFSNLFLE